MHERIHDFIRRSSTGDAGPAEFESLALDVFRHQYETVAPYARLADAVGRTPATVGTIDEIPAAPADLFKEPALFDHRDGAAVEFTSSGTTSGGARPSRHRIGDLNSYELGATAHFRRMVLADRPREVTALLMGPSATTHPQSSLGRMFSWCVEHFADERSTSVFDADGRVDLDAAVAWLEQAAAAPTPVLLLGVSSAVSALLRRLGDERRSIRLPAASRLVDTGGAKGGPVLSAKGLIKAAWHRLHVPGYACVNEYGMTEMLSQFYDDALERRTLGLLGPRAKVGPPWVRTWIVDPATLEPVADRDRGLLRHFDLVNWDSVSMLQTLDVGRRLGRGFEVLGRAAGADTRGCSQLFVAAGIERT